MSTNLHIDDIGNLILRDGKLGLFVSSQNTTPPHYGGGRVGALCPYAVEQVNHYYPYGGLFAESAGGEMQAFKYNGKVLAAKKKIDNLRREDEPLGEGKDRLGLNWYDHSARHNDAAIGRWHCIDPLAEKYYSISPYVYCADNPVMFVDLSGMAPDSIEAAQMVKHVYQDEKVELVGGWSCVRLSYDDKTGLQYGIYQRCNSAESIETCLVFAGTNDGTDTKLDYEQYNGMGNEIWDTQYGQAALIALSQMASLAPGEELSFSGHSLGGALAQIASMMTDAPAITFNPAGIHNKTMSEQGLIGSNTSQIQNYVISGEVVSMSTMANANVKTYGNTNYRTYNYSRFNEIAIYQSAQNHKMKNF